MEDNGAPTALESYVPESVLRSDTF
jgi:hypothetical protein